MKEGDYLKTGEKIKKYRKEQSLTQKALAEKLNTTPQNLAQYENGKRNPKPRTLWRIANALNIDMDCLLPDRADFSLVRDSDLLTFNSLSQVVGFSGYTFGRTDDTDDLYICFPDGILKLSHDDAADLQKDIRSYTDFRMQQFKKEHISDFVPEAFFDYTTCTIKPEYKKQSNSQKKTAVPDSVATHAHTDVEQTPEGIQHDLDIMNDNSMRDKK